MVKELKICALCGCSIATQEHHLIFGSSKRRLADEDGLTLMLCGDCHTSGSLTTRLHDNIAAEKLSKMLGQAIYESNNIAAGDTKEQAREKFLQRYGISYL